MKKYIIKQKVQIKTIKRCHFFLYLPKQLTISIIPVVKFWENKLEQLFWMTVWKFSKALTVYNY